MTADSNEMKMIVFECATTSSNWHCNILYYYSNTQHLLFYGDILQCTNLYMIHTITVSIFLLFLFYFFLGFGFSLFFLFYNSLFDFVTKVINFIHFVYRCVAPSCCCFVTITCFVIKYDYFFLHFFVFVFFFHLHFSLWLMIMAYFFSYISHSFTTE